MKKAQPSITQQEVDEFAKICARMKEDDARRRVLRLKFIEAREKGLAFPDSGPYLINFVPKSRLDIAWKEEAKILARVLFGSLPAAEEHIKQVEEDAEVTPIIEVSTKANPNWTAKPNILRMPTKAKARAK